MNFWKMGIEWRSNNNLLKGRHPGHSSLQKRTQKRSEPVYPTGPQGGPGVRSVAEEDVWNEESEIGALFTEHWHAHAPPSGCLSRTPTCLLRTAGLTYPRQGTGKFYSGETYSSHRRNSHESRQWKCPLASQSPSWGTHWARCLIHTLRAWN